MFSLPFLLFLCMLLFEITSFSFWTLPILAKFLPTLSHPVFPCLTGEGEQGEGASGEAAPGWALQGLHGLRLLLLQQDIWPYKHCTATGRLRQIQPAIMETGQGLLKREVAQNKTPPQWLIKHVCSWFYLFSSARWMTDFFGTNTWSRILSTSR